MEKLFGIIKVFIILMSLLHRFKFICHLIAFGNEEIRNDRWKTWKVVRIGELFEDMNERNSGMRYPSPLLDIDETLYPYHGHIIFKQYNPNKPAKYGLLYRRLCNSSIPYICYTLPYAGKSGKVEGPATKYYFTRTGEYSRYLINKLSVYWNLQ